MKGNETRMQLSGGWSATKDFYDKVREDIEEIIPAYKPEWKLKLREICSPYFWSPLSLGDKQLAGRCVAHMVKNGVLTFDFAVGRKTYPKKYKKK